MRRVQHDHLRVEALIARMRDYRDHGARYEVLHNFAETLRVHVRGEEQTLFPDTESTLTEVELDALGAELEERLPATPLPFPS